MNRDFTLKSMISSKSSSFVPSACKLLLVNCYATFYSMSFVQWSFQLSCSDHIQPRYIEHLLFALGVFFLMNLSFNIQLYLPSDSKINIPLNFTWSNLSASVTGPSLVSSVVANRPQDCLCQSCIRVKTTEV